MDVILVFGFYNILQYFRSLRNCKKLPFLYISHLFLLENTTLITGDLIRAHEGGKLCMLPDVKLKDRQAAVASVKRMASLENIQAVLPGDGWPIFSQGKEALNQLAASI